MPGPSRRLVALMAMSCALAVSTLYFHQPLLAQIATSFGLAPAQASLVATLTQLGYALGLVLIVPLADCRQPRTLACAAIAANALALLASAGATQFVLLCAASFAVGVTAITAQIIIPTLAGVTAPAARGQVVGSLLGGLSTGLLLARTVGGVLGDQMGWRAVFALAALVDALLLLVVAMALPRVAHPVQASYLTLLRSLPRLLREEPMLRFSAACGFMMFAAFSALWASLAALLTAPPYGFSPASIGLLGLAAAFGILASPRIGALADHLGTPRTLMLGVAALLVGFALVAAGGHSLVALIAGMVLLDLGNRAGLLANQARIYALRAEARSRLNTVFMGSYFLGGATGAAIGSYGAHHGGWAGLALVGAVFTVGAGLINAWSVLGIRKV
ncbi:MULTISPECIES: MFS transporter [unclassified Pseudomonas]|uniref:MFS transporter n=1 Tax=unclassified Pseudomonas TaxID=196821 RepID=UPI0035BF67EC